MKPTKDTNATTTALKNLNLNPTLNYSPPPVITGSNSNGLQLYGQSDSLENGSYNDNEYTKGRVFFRSFKICF